MVRKCRARTGSRKFSRSTCPPTRSTSEGLEKEKDGPQGKEVKMWDRSWSCPGYDAQPSLAVSRAVRACTRWALSGQLHAWENRTQASEGCSALRGNIKFDESKSSKSGVGAGESESESNDG